MLLEVFLIADVVFADQGSILALAIHHLTIGPVHFHLSVEPPSQPGARNLLSVRVDLRAHAVAFPVLEAAKVFDPVLVGLLIEVLEVEWLPVIRADLLEEDTTIAVVLAIFELTFVEREANFGI